jgi:hypothetical protein
MENELILLILSPAQNSSTTRPQCFWGNQEIDSVRMSDLLTCRLRTLFMDNWLVRLRYAMKNLFRSTTENWQIKTQKRKVSVFSTGAGWNPVKWKNFLTSLGTNWSDGLISTFSTAHFFSECLYWLKKFWFLLKNSKRRESSGHF